ncbi:L-lactate permease [Dermabacteraceae bacterium P13103]
MWQWLASIAPVAVLFSAIAFFRVRIPRAGALGLATALASAALLGTLTLPVLADSVGGGLSAALSILYAVWPAIFLYEFMREGESFTVLKDAATSLSGDRMILVLLFGWVFSSFLQSITGFGVPVAVCAPFLIALGVRPVAAVMLTLLGHAWANTYGTLGLAWDALVDLSGVQNVAATSLYAGIFLWLINLSGALIMCFLYGRGPAVRHALPFVLAVSAVMAGGQIAVGQVNPTIAAFVPTAAAFVLVLGAFRLGIYTSEWSCQSRLLDAPAQADAPPAAPATPATGNVLTSAAPFLFLAASSLLLFTLPGLHDSLSGLRLLGVPLFYHAGTVLTLTAVFALLLLRREGGVDRAGTASACRAALTKLLPTSLGIAALLVLARLLFNTGQIEILAQGVAATAGIAYLPFTAALGTFGAFVTSSNMSSNILLAAFQSEVAAQLAAPAPLILAAQTAGGAAGAVIGPSTILLGATTAGVQGREGEILRPLLVISLAQALVVGLALSVWIGVAA